MELTLFIFVILAFDRLAASHRYNFVYKIDNSSTIELGSNWPFAAFDLKNKNISKLKVNMFHPHTELQKIDLSFNQIEQIPSFLFFKTEKLIDVNFSYNNIRVIDDFAFSGNVNLKKLDLSHNVITYFRKKFIKNQSNLRHLDLSFNRIAILDAGIFDHLGDLMMLNLAFNHISTLENVIGNFDGNTMDNLAKLQHLNLSDNSLTEIESGTFSSLTNLQTLDLSFNMLSTLNINILPVQPNSMRLLSFAKNQVVELIGFTKFNISKMKLIGIDSNEFNCSYLHKFFESITWRQLDSISERIMCNEYSTIPTNIGTLSIYAFFFQLVVQILLLNVYHTCGDFLFSNLNSRKKDRISKKNDQRLRKKWNRLESKLRLEKTLDEMEQHSRMKPNTFIIECNFRPTIETIDEPEESRNNMQEIPETPEDIYESPEEMPETLQEDLRISNESLSDSIEILDDDFELYSFSE